MELLLKLLAKPLTIFEKFSFFDFSVLYTMIWENGTKIWIDKDRFFDSLYKSIKTEIN